MTSIMRSMRILGSELHLKNAKVLIQCVGLGIGLHAYLTGGHWKVMTITLAIHKPQTKNMIVYTVVLKVFDGKMRNRKMRIDSLAEAMRGYIASYMRLGAR